jgi:hypothetical protein
MKMKHKNNGSKIAHRNAILGTFVRTVIPDGADALIRFTGRGVIIEKHPEGRRGFHLKWVDAKTKKGRNQVYRVQLQGEDVRALQTDDCDHLLVHLGGADYPFCVITRAELLKMGLSGGGCIVICYTRGSRKFRVTGGAVTLEKPLLVELRRFWHSVPEIQSELPLAA